MLKKVVCMYDVEEGVCVSHSNCCAVLLQIHRQTETTVSGEFSRLLSLLPV